MKMFRGYLIAAASLALCGCSLATSFAGGLPTTPAEIADTTVVDEKVALSVELAYQAAGTAVKFAAETGVLRGDAALQAKAIDARAYRAVQSARTAYDAGNALSYIDAERIARSEIAALLRLVT